MATRPAHRLHRKNPSPVRENKIKEITPYLDKYVKVHGANHPLHQIKALFMESAEDPDPTFVQRRNHPISYPTHVCRVS